LSVAVQQLAQIAVDLTSLMGLSVSFLVLVAPIALVSFVNLVLHWILFAPHVTAQAVVSVALGVIWLSELDAQRPVPVIPTIVLVSVPVS